MIKFRKLKKAFRVVDKEKYVFVDYNKIMTDLYEEYGDIMTEIRELGNQIDFTKDKDEKAELWSDYCFKEGISEGLVIAIKIIENANLERKIEHG